MIDGHSILSSGKYFGENGTQNFLVFQPFCKCITYFRNVSKISSWTSKVMSEKRIKNPSTTGSSFAPTWVDKCLIPKLKSNGNCLRQNSMSFIHVNVLNLYIFLYM